MSRPKISILVSIYANRAKQFKLSLQSLANQKFNPNSVELLVFIDCSRYKSILDYLNKYNHIFSAVTYFTFHKKNNIVTHSCTRRNFLALHAHGEYLLFCEPEILHISNTIKICLDFIQKDRYKYWLCGPTYGTDGMVNSKGDVVVYEYAKREKINSLLSLIKNGRLDLSDPKTVKYYNKIDEKKFKIFFFCALLHRKQFIKLGGLNQKLRVRGWEEIEFHQRFLKNKGKYIFNNKFVTCHLPHKKSFDVVLQKGWDLYNSTVLFDKNQKIDNINEQITTHFIL